MKLLKAVCAVVVMGMCLLSACSEEAPPETVPTEPRLQIETVYGPLFFPETMSDVMLHEEVREEGMVSEIFRMNAKGQPTEVSRLTFGKAYEDGVLIGYLSVDEKSIEIYYTTYAYESDAFQNEAERKTYFDILDGVNEAINTLCEDERFSQMKRVDLGEESLREFKYWSLQLPSKITYTETSRNGEYVVDFFGEMENGQIPLYSVGFDELTSDYAIGECEADGTTKTVYVTVSNFQTDPDWSEDEQNMAYRMMDTLNDVTAAIVPD